MLNWELDVLELKACAGRWTGISNVGQGTIKAVDWKKENGVDCDLDGADHIVDFKTLQGLSHYDNTSSIPGATLEKRKKAVNKEYHDRTKKLEQRRSLFNAETDAETT